MADTSPRPHPGGLARNAYLTIKEDILRCRLEPGERVNRAALNERYGYGDAATREALNRLSQEELVEVLPREGYRIAPITLKDVNDLFATRLILEPALARQAAGNLDPNQLRILQQEGDQPAAWRNRAELEDYARANAAFHLAIARASGNRRVIRMMETLLDDLKRTMLLSYLLGNRSHGLENAHPELVDALIAGDADRAAAAMTFDIETSHHFVVGGLMLSPDLQSVSLGLGSARPTAEPPE